MDKMYTYQSKRYAGGDRSVPKEPTYEKTDEFPMTNRFESTTDRRRQTQPMMPQQLQSKAALRFNYVAPNRRETEDDSGATWGNGNRINSQTDLKLKLQFQGEADSIKKPKYIRRKNDGVVNTLKSQLQNLKQEVSKLMSKESSTIRRRDPIIRKEDSNPVVHKKVSSKDDSMQPSQYSVPSSSYESLESYQAEQIVRQNSYRSRAMAEDKSNMIEKDDSDIVSVTSERIIDAPIRQLAMRANTMNYDHGQYMELENELLKTELRNLKNKYNSKKIELNEKCDILVRKNQYLELSIQKSEESLLEYKTALDSEIKTIRSQLARKYEMELQSSQMKLEELAKGHKNEAQRDLGDNDNELLQEKFKKLLEEITDKNRHINNLNIDLNETKADKEKTAFELRKEKQKNEELFKQTELAKRQLSRTQDHLEAQILKKSQLGKSLEAFKSKNVELQAEMESSGKLPAEELDSRLYEDINHYKQIESELRIQASEMASKKRKMQQLLDSQKLEIEHLKKGNDDSMKQVEQLSRMLRTEKQKALETEDEFRKIIQDNSRREDEKIQLLKQEYDIRIQSQMDSFSVNVHEEIRNIDKSPGHQPSEYQVNEALKEKEMQIRKWKAEYKLLKLKVEEKESLDKNKKVESDKYYQQYIEFKHRNRSLESRNEALKKQIEDLAEKMKKMEMSDISIKGRMKKDSSRVEYQLIVAKKEISDLNDENKQMGKKLEEEVHKSEKEVIYRKEIEEKIFEMNLDDESQIGEMLEKMKKRVAQQDEKINKQYREIKSKDQLVSKLKKEVRDLLQSKESDINQIKTKELEEATKEVMEKQFCYVDELKFSSRKAIQLENTRFMELSKEAGEVKQKLNELESESMRLRQENQSLSHLYNDKVADQEAIQVRFSAQKEQYEQRLSEARMEKFQKQNNLSNEFKFKNEEIQSLREEVRKLNTFFTARESKPSFDDALKEQMETNERLREEYNKKTEEMFLVRDSYSSLRSQYDNLKSEVEIIKLKAISEKKNIQVSYEVEIQNLKNKTTIEEKKVGSLDQKMQLIIEETKKKDSFIQTYIMGKKLPQGDKEFLTEFTKKYELQMGTGKTLSDRLKTESSELDKLSQSNYNLFKELAEMKEKMLIYEATSPDKSESLGRSGQLRSSDFQSQHKPKSPKSPSSVRKPLFRKESR